MEFCEKNLIKILHLPIKNRGYELLDVTFNKRGSERIIQLFIYSPHGIDIDDCVNVNELASDIIDNSGNIFKNYTLEISSPGIYRPLKKPEHFKIFMGKRIKVILQKKIQGFKIVIGNIEKCSEEGITMKIENIRKILDIPFRQIDRANLEPDIKIN